MTIKIRTGWDEDSLNALEVIRIAREEGVEFVAVHGRTRTQQYRGEANWNFLEQLAKENVLPIIGNGDLHTAMLTKQRLKNTSCQALMLGRGPLRNPFIFLESFLEAGERTPFQASDYWEITEKLFELMSATTERERTLLVQMRKHVMWFAAGFPGASQFRAQLFQMQDLDQTLRSTQDFFLGQSGAKQLDDYDSFMTSGHG